MQEESPFEENSTAEEPYYMKENSYQALRGRGTQRKLTEPRCKHCKTGNGVLVRPSPLIRKESQPAPSSIKLKLQERMELKKSGSSLLVYSQEKSSFLLI